MDFILLVLFLSLKSHNSCNFVFNLLSMSQSPNLFVCHLNMTHHKSESDLRPTKTLTEPMYSDKSTVTSIQLFHFPTPGYSSLQRRLEVATLKQVRRKEAPGDRERSSSRSNLGTVRHREICVKKFGRFHQIILCPITTRLRAGLNVQVSWVRCGRVKGGRGMVEILKMPVGWWPLAMDLL